MDFNNSEPTDATHSMTDARMTSASSALKINTIFESPRDFLLERECHVGQELENQVICPELDIFIQNRPVNSLIDTGSKITCISEEVYNKNIEVLRSCPTLPLNQFTSIRVYGRKIGPFEKVGSRAN